jgi:hypothetical protein
MKMTFEQFCEEKNFAVLELMATAAAGNMFRKGFPPDTTETGLIILKRMHQYFVENGYLPSAFAFAMIVDQLDLNRAAARSVASAPIVEPIPHQDLWPGIDTKLKWFEYTKTRKIPTTLAKQWDELGFHLQTHPELRGSATEAKKLTPTTGVALGDDNPIRGLSSNVIEEKKTPTPPGFVKIKVNYSGDLAVAHDEINRLTLADVGTTSSSVGRREGLSRIKDSLHHRADEMATTQSGKAVLRWVREQIREYGSSSVR